MGQTNRKKICLPHSILLNLCCNKAFLPKSLCLILKKSQKNKKSILGSTPSKETKKRLFLTSFLKTTHLF